MVAACSLQPAWGGVPSFAPPRAIDLPAGHFPTQPALADLDEDGRLDLVVPGRNVDGTASLILAAGSVAPSIVPLTVGGQSDWAEVADLDGDGHLDVVFAVRNIRGGVAILRGHGDGTFDAARFLWTGRECRCVAVGDIDADGRIDIAACNAASGSVQVLRNTGGLAFQPMPVAGVNRWNVGSPNQSWITLRGQGAGSRLLDVAVGGGRLDMRSASGGVLVNERSWAVPSVQGSVPGVSFAEIADLDGDGQPEWISQGLTTLGLNPLLVWRGLADGSPGAMQSWSGPSYGRGWRAVTADLDGDGDRDVLSLSVLDGQLVALENTSVPGTIELQPSVPLLDGYFLRHVVAGDVDGDGRPDLLVCDSTESRVLLMRNLGPAGFAAKASTARRHAGELGSVDPPTELARLLAFGPSAAAGGEMDGVRPMSLPSSCGPGAGRCDEAHDTPGCYTPSCCELVCLLLPECCDLAWDQGCVDWASSECDGLVCPSPGSCLTPHGKAGCDDAECCERVRRLDPVCEAVWDELCVELAQLSCGIEPPVVAPPSGAIDEAEPCGQRLSEGCGFRAAPVFQTVQVGQVRAGRVQAFGVRDIDAHVLTLSGPAAIRLELHPDFPAHMVLATGSCSGPLETLAESCVAPGGLARIDAVLAAGDYRITVSMATPLQTLREGQPCPVTDPDGTVQPGLFGGVWWMSLRDRTAQAACDLDGSGQVDAADIGSLLLLFGSSGPAGDLDGSGEVDAGDIGSLLICFD